jgi:hypothetical protein
MLGKITHAEALVERSEYGKFIDVLDLMGVPYEVEIVENLIYLKIGTKAKATFMFSNRPFHDDTIGPSGYLIGCFVDGETIQRRYLQEGSILPIATGKDAIIAQYDLSEEISRYNQAKAERERFQNELDLQEFERLKAKLGK